MDGKLVAREDLEAPVANTLTNGSVLEYSAPVLRPAENPFNFDLASHNGPMSEPHIRNTRKKVRVERMRSVGV